MDHDIRFCTTPDGVRLAYALAGRGRPLLKAANWLNHLEFDWHSPIWRPWFEGLARDLQLVRYDERGTGLSDWHVDEFSFDAYVSDLEAVADAAELDRFSLLGISQGGSIAIAYAVRHPERVSHLILYGSYVRGRKQRPLTERDREEFDALLSLIRIGWGQDNPAFRQIFTSFFVPEGTPEQFRWFNDLERISTSPENAARIVDSFAHIDVRDLATQVMVPTLVMHARRDSRIPFEEGRLAAALIPGARFVPLESNNHILLEHEPALGRLLSEVRRFLGVEEGEPAAAEGVPAAGPSPFSLNRMFTTVLFTDIVNSTARASELGDVQWRHVVDQHNRLTRQAIAEYGGQEIRSTGDGFLITFAVPSRAILCAQAIIARMPSLGLEMRAGIHSGEVELHGDDLAGLGVHIAARILDLAGSNTILVSGTVRDLVIGSGIELQVRGRHALKGVPGEWHLFEAISR